MMKRLSYIILTLFTIVSCDSSPRQISDSGREGFVFKSAPNEKDISFIPTDSQIDRAENKLAEYLMKKTKNHETIYENVFNEKIPLEDRLKYYKRRYFGRINIENEKVIKIEFVFVRCAGNEEWKKIEYTTEKNKECWWTVQYNINSDDIYDLRH